MSEYHLQNILRWISSSFPYSNTAHTLMQSYLSLPKGLAEKSFAGVISRWPKSTKKPTWKTFLPPDLQHRWCQISTFFLRGVQVGGWNEAFFFGTRQARVASWHGRLSLSQLAKSHGQETDLVFTWLSSDSQMVFYRHIPVYVYTVYIYIYILIYIYVYTVYIYIYIYVWILVHTHTLSRKHVLFDYTWIMNGHIKMRAVLVVALQVSISMQRGINL